MTFDVIMVCINTMGVIAVAVGLGITIRDNGKKQKARDDEIAKAQAERDTILANNQKAILSRLDDKEHGLQAVNDKIGDVKQNCAGVTASFAERLTGHDREIKELKTKK